MDAEPLKSLIATGTKVWLDSVDPAAVVQNRAWGATGATSNPIIISDLIKTGKFDTQLAKFISQGLPDADIAWQLTDMLVRQAQEVFLPVWETTKGDNGYVSFELDPLLDALDSKMPVQERSTHYIELGMQWSKGHKNRMIKVPATPAGIGAMEELLAAGVTVNVTLIFSEEQYHASRDAIWRGARRRPSLESFKSVYSIFVSRLDVYTAQKVPQLSPAAQGQVGIVNAKRIGKLNQQFWADKKLPLKQEMIFASTGTKKKEDPPWKYVEAFAGDGIETNPPATNDIIQKCSRTFSRMVDQMPPKAVLDEIDAKVDMHLLEKTLMEEGLKKFADPQKALLQLIAKKRESLATAAKH
jgi:transaldolase